MPSSSLPTAFTRLWAASAITNLGDGALLAAGHCSSPPSPPTGLSARRRHVRPATALAAVRPGQRRTRRPAAPPSARPGGQPGPGLALTFLAVAITVDEPRLWLIYPVLFLLGVGETLADSAALPIGFHALAQFFAVIVFAKLAVESTVDRTGESLRADVAAGLRWLWRHPGLRLLTACILVMNLTSVGVFAVWVLYATEHLGLTTTQYGLFISVSALGSIGGAWAYGRLEARFGHVTLLRGGLVVEALTYAALTLTREPLTAGLIMMLFGAHAAVWGTVSTTVRQRATPSALMGRVGSVYHLASVGGAAIGALTVLVWRRLPHTAP